MARLDHHAFGQAVRARLDGLGFSYSDAETRWPELNRAMLSRAVNGKPLSVENYLLICRLLRLPVYAFWRREKRQRMTMKTILKQAVTAPDKRETLEQGPC